MWGSNLISARSDPVYNPTGTVSVLSGWSAAPPSSFRLCLPTCSTAGLEVHKAIRGLTSQHLASVSTAGLVSGRRSLGSLFGDEQRVAECTHPLEGGNRIQYGPVPACPVVQLFKDWMGEGRVRNSPICSVTWPFHQEGEEKHWLGKLHSRPGCGHRLLFILRSLMGTTPYDIQETLKKYGLSFWVCPELSGHRS